MIPIGSHRLTCIQLEQQILHKFGVGCEFIVAAVMVLQKCLLTASLRCPCWMQREYRAEYHLQLSLVNVLVFPGCTSL